jgi:hypothetical protein
VNRDLILRLFFYSPDLGNTDYEYQDTAIKGILKALNNIQGIKSVIVNEDCGFDF